MCSPRGGAHTGGAHGALRCTRGGGTARRQRSPPEEVHRPRSGQMCFCISVRGPSAHAPHHGATTLAVGVQRCGGRGWPRSRGAGQGLQAQCWPAPSGQTSIPRCHSGLPTSAKAPARQGPSPLPTQTPKAPVPRECPPTRRALGTGGDREAVIWACSASTDRGAQAGMASLPDALLSGRLSGRLHELTGQLGLLLPPSQRVSAPLPVTEAQVPLTATGGCSPPALPTPPPPRSARPHPATSHTLLPLPEVFSLFTSSSPSSDVIS